MRVPALTLFALLLWPAMAAAEPGAQELLNGAIKALQTASYQGRMKFISQLDNGQLREVQIYHSAPDAYRVEPLLNGRPSGGFFIEDSDALLWISGEDVKTLPSRRFAVNDALTALFLRELGQHDGTSVLAGQVGERPVWMLRNDSLPGSKFVVTVGIDKITQFPVFLLVSDAAGRSKVHFEMQSIQFREAGELSPTLFSLPRSRDRRELPGRPNSGNALLQVQGPQAPLPLYPSWLPRNYRVESASMLECPKGDADCALIYQLEAYGPRVTDMVSIFQMFAEGDDDAIKRLGRSIPPDAGYVLVKNGPWVVAVFGSLEPEELTKIATKLQPSEEAMRALLRQTAQLDRIMEQAVPNGQ